VKPRAHLVVNADDLGYSDGVNRGILEAHARGIVTSASLMVRGAAAEAAAAVAPGTLGLGLHLDLGEWEFAGGAWRQVVHVVDTTDAGAVARELEHQLSRFRRLLGRDPTHLDSHQHAHRHEPARTAARALADGLGVPLRHESPILFCGDFYGQDDEGLPMPWLVAPERLERLLRGLPDGATELCCHPGYADGLRSAYAAERELELAALCSPRLRPLLAAERIALVTFAEVPLESAA
jgi:predicted glycoside hydrolase/deacetylase ChbG (UPF0249 family)